MTASRFEPKYPHVGSRTLSYRAVNDIMRGRQEQMAQQPILSSGRLRDVLVQPAMALVRNDSGGDVVRGGVLALSDLVFDAADNEDAFWSQPLFTGTTPQRDLEDNDLGAVGIAIEPIPDEEIGTVAVSGVVAALVNIGATTHQYCDITDNSVAELTSQVYGPYRILHQPGSTGAGKKCVILLGPNSEERILLGKTDASHAAGASGTISVYDGTKGSESDTTRNITAWNRFADIDSGKWVLCAWVWNGYELIAAEC